MSLGTFAHIVALGAYGIFLLVFIGLSAYSILHVFKYSYLSPRTVVFTWAYIVFSVVIIGYSLYVVAYLL